MRGKKQNRRPIKGYSNHISKPFFTKYYFYLKMHVVHSFGPN
jgi:hypothetical protein